MPAGRGTVRHLSLGVVKWSQRLRRTGSSAPAKQGAAPPRKLAGERAFILSRLAEHPSITTRALAGELCGQGIEVTHMAVWHLMPRRRLDVQKKTALADEQTRHDVARRRQRWRLHQKQIDPHRLVFVDETWTKTNMAPLRGWGPAAHPSGCIGFPRASRPLQARCARQGSAELRRSAAGPEPPGGSTTPVRRSMGPRAIPNDRTRPFGRRLLVDHGSGPSPDLMTVYGHRGKRSCPSPSATNVPASGSRR